MAFNVTDLQLQIDLEYSLLENGDANADGTGLLTDMFSIVEMTDALNDSQRRFLKDTALIQTRTTIAGIAGVPRYTLPTDWVETRRVTWRDIGDTDKIRALTRTDAFELDRGLTDWTTDLDRPIVYHESTLPTLTLELAKAPSDVGTIGLLYTALPTTLGGSGTVMSIPDEWTPYVKWGALAALLGQDGEGHDPERAQYCQTRYDEGVMLARVLLGGIGG